VNVVDDHRHARAPARGGENSRLCRVGVNDVGLLLAQDFSTAAARASLSTDEPGG